MKKISVGELKDLLAAGQTGVLIVDVREVDEVRDTPLFSEQTRYLVNLPLSIIRVLSKEEIRKRCTDFLETAGTQLAHTRIIVSCRSGGRSSQAQALCAIAGIETENLTGGYQAWQEAKENEATR